MFSTLQQKIQRSSKTKHFFAVLSFCTLTACGDDAATDERYGEPGARIYATVSATNQVLAFDDATHKQVDTFSVGKGPAIILATKNYDKLYTANWADDTVSAIDLAAHQVKNIAVSGRPYIIAMDPASQYVYAGLASNEIAVIDTATDTVTRSIPMAELPASIIVSGDGKTLYVAFLGLGLFPGTLVAISAETGKVVHPALTVGNSPAWITISPDGRKVYSLNFLSDDVTVIDTASWKIDATVETGAGTSGIIGNVTPDSKRLYVTNHGSSDLVAIDTVENKVVQTIPLTGRPVGVNFSPDGKRVYTTDFGPNSKNEPLKLNYLVGGQYEATGDGQLSVFDVATGEPVGPSIPVPPGPTSVVVAPAAK